MQSLLRKIKSERLLLTQPKRELFYKIAILLPKFMLSIVMSGSSFRHFIDKL